MSSLCYITYYLMTGLSGTVNFVSLESRFSGNNINCFPRDQSLSVYYLPLECNNYKVLNDNDRAKGHQGGLVKCDRSSFVKAWYKFEGGAGDQMPNACVPTSRCGTHAPGWLNGVHPTMAEGAVSRKVCFHWSGNCCKWSSSIRVRNCGNFYVYELPPTQYCNLRYCGNGAQGKCGLTLITVGLSLKLLIYIWG